MRDISKNTTKTLFMVVLWLALGASACQSASAPTSIQTKTQIPGLTETLQPTVSATVSVTPSPLPTSTFTLSPAPSETVSSSPTPSPTFVNVITPELTMPKYWMERAYNEDHQELGIQITKSNGEGPFIIFAKETSMVIRQFFWSPDGQKVYIITDTGTTRSIYGVTINPANPSKSSATEIYSDPLLEFAILSPNGARMAILYWPIKNFPEEQLEKPHVSILNISTRQANEVLFTGISWPDSIKFSQHPWSSDSNGLVFMATYTDDQDRYSDIFVANLSGSVTNLMVSGKPGEAMRGSKYIASAIWAPKQEKIYYYVSPEHAIFSISSKGGKPTQVMSGEIIVPENDVFQSDALSISPDGTWLYVPIITDQQFNPILFNTRNQNTTIISSDRVSFLYHPIYWSPDSSQIGLACLPAFGDGGYYVFDIKSGNLTEITTVIPTWILNSEKIWSPR